MTEPSRDRPRESGSSWLTCGTNSAGKMGRGAGGRFLTLGTLFVSLSVDGLLEKRKRLLTCKKKKKKERVRGY